jgi:hypothetical protein
MGLGITVSAGVASGLVPLPTFQAPALIPQIILPSPGLITTTSALSFIPEIWSSYAMTSLYGRSWLDVDEMISTIPSVYRGTMPAVFEKDTLTMYVKRDDAWTQY